MGSLYKRGRIYWLQYYANGRAIRESAGTGDQKEARRLLKLKEGAVAKGERVDRPGERITVEAALDDVVNDYRAHGRKTLGHLQRHMRKYLLPYFGGKKLAAITAADCRGFITWRQGEFKEGNTNAEINRELGGLSKAFTLALQTGRIPARPYIPRLKESAPRSDFYSREQFEVLSRFLPEYIKPVVRFMYITGWRKREVLDLTWRLVDFDAGLVRLDVGTTKTGEGRVFPFTQELKALLIEQQKVHRSLAAGGVVCPLVFPSDGKKGRRSDRRIWTFWKTWQTARRRAGIPGHIPHGFRRTACRNLIRAGVPEKVAMQMVGWRSRQMLDRYNIVSEGDLKEAAQKLDRVGR